MAAPSAIWRLSLSICHLPHVGGQTEIDTVRDRARACCNSNRNALLSRHDAAALTWPDGVGAMCDISGRLRRAPHASDVQAKLSPSFGATLGALNVGSRKRTFKV